MKGRFKQLVRSMLWKAGYTVQRRTAKEWENFDYGFDNEEAARKAIAVVEEYTMLTYPRLVTLYEQATYCEKNNIRGAYVECGTWKGGAIGLMALVNLETSPERRELHLFDSFEGIPQPDAAMDGRRAIEEVQAIGGQTQGYLEAVPGFYEQYASGIGTLEDNKRLLENIIGYEASFIHYHVGWFQDTVPVEAPSLGNIAILRLDGDWYSSTKVCLEYLYDYVVLGGVVIIDDYGHYDGCKMAVDEFRHERQIVDYLHYIDYSARYWIKAHKI